MIRKVLPAFAAALLVAGCGSSSTPAASDQEIGATALQQFDANNGQNEQPTGAYRAELDILTTKCTNPTKDVARFVENTYNLEVQAGITDETAFTLLKHLDASVPDGTKTDCQGVLAAYLTLREG